MGTDWNRIHELACRLRTLGLEATRLVGQRHVDEAAVTISWQAGGGFSLAFYCSALDLGGGSRHHLQELDNAEQLLQTLEDMVGLAEEELRQFRLPKGEDE